MKKILNAHSRFVFSKISADIDTLNTEWMSIEE